MALVGGGCIYRRCIAVGEMGSRVRNIRPSVVTGVHYNGCIVPSKPIYSGHSEYALKGNQCNTYHGRVLLIYFFQMPKQEMWRN